jgi:hypothetical protein
MPSVREHRLGRGGVRLLDETAERVRRRRGGHVGRRGQFEPAIAGLGPVGQDPERDELALPRGRRSGRDRRPKGLGIGDGMIRGADQHQAFRSAIRDLQRRREHGRPGVPPLRLDQHRPRRASDLAHLLGHDEAELGAGDDHRPGEFRLGQAGQRSL